MRQDSVEFEIKDSWIDFLRYVIGLEGGDEDEKEEEEEVPSFSKVMARVTSTEPSTAESDEENEHSQTDQKNVFLKLIPDWVIKSN